MHDLLFHIGMGKTGTSSIQYALDSSADRLAAKGVRYLGMWMGERFLRSSWTSSVA